MMLRKLKTRDNGIRAVIALFMACIVAISIGRADLTTDYNVLSVMLTTVIIGFMAGFFLAISRFPTFTALIYSIVYGAFTVMWVVGRELPDDLIWRERVAELIARKADWFAQVFSGGTSRDNLIFIIQTSLIMWSLGYSAAWSTIRRPRVWRVILPGGIVLLSIIYNYYGTKPLALYLALYCILSLIYISLTHLALRKDDWLYEQVRFDNSITNNFLRGAAVIALVGMILSALIPAFSSNNRVEMIVDTVNEPWERVQQEWQRVYSQIGGQRVATAKDPRRDQLTLGGERNPSDELVMDVYTAEIPYAYWRSYVYNTYTQDGTWDVNFGERTMIPAQGDIPTSRLLNQDRVQIEQTFQILGDNIATMYAAPDFSWGDREINGYVDPTTNEMTHIRSRFIMDRGDSYRVLSEMSMADKATLRRASTSVPPAIENYLQLPDSITDRTRALARDITSGMTNNYDKVEAIEAYLRINIQYSDQISAPPSDVEVVDYFLFDLKTGYCNYYASAFTVMARSLGIPSRIASGFASGEYNPDSGAYRVRARDAHTWPEVYFPGYGWIQFEPTVIIAPPSRLSGEDPLEEEATPTPLPTPTLNPDLFAELTPSPTPEPEIPLDPADIQASYEPEDPPLISRTLLIRIVTAVLLLGLLLGAFTAAQRINRAVEGDVEKSYGRLSLWARWIGVRFRPSNTPAERADIMSNAVPEGEQPINRLTGEYARMQYSLKEKEKSRRRFNPLEEWRELRPILLKSGLAKRLPNWLKRQKE